MAAPYIPRADALPDCKNATIVPSLLGLNYTKFCNYDLPGNDIENIACDSFELCIEKCTRHGPACYGVTFDEQKCFFKGKGIGPDLVPKTNATSALANPKAFAQDPRDFWCPFPNLSTQKLREEKGGLEYTVLCGGDLPYDDLYHASNFALPELRAKSLEECVENCVKIHPFCSHVSYNADWSGSFMNCWPKSGGRQRLVLHTHTGMIMHSAVLKVPKLDKPRCKDGEIKVVGEGDGGKRFKISCSDWRGDLNVTGVGMGNGIVGVSHEKTVGDCTNKCGDFRADSHSDSTSKCVGAAFDVGLQSGYMNCYLFDSIPPPRDAHANYTFVFLENLEHEFRAPPPALKSGGNRAWVAGVVVPSVVLIGALGSWLWWRRQKGKGKRKGHED